VERSIYQPAETLLLIEPIQLPPCSLQLVGGDMASDDMQYKCLLLVLFPDVKAHGFTVTPMLMKQ
jgi:hypothetical protein